MARQSFFTRSQIVAIPIPWKIWKGIGERSDMKIVLIINALMMQWLILEIYRQFSFFDIVLVGN